MNESEFRFIGYRVTNASFSLNDVFPDGDEKFSHSIKIANKFDEKDKRLVEVVLGVIVENEKKTFKFTLELKGAFKASDSMSDELFIQLSKQNGPAILFPYARALISTYTAQANIPPVILPSINFTLIK